MMPTVRTGDFNIAAAAGYTQLFMAMGTREIFIGLAVSDTAAVFSEDFLNGRGNLQELLIFTLSGRDIAGQHTENKGNRRKKRKGLQ